MVADLIRAQRAGYTLTRELYTDPQVFERDLDAMLLRHWFCAGHVSSLAKSGRYFVVDMGAESVILVRNHDGEIKALLNVCRHRGSRVCTDRSGKAPAGILTCPYHAWSYDLNGRLVAARQMPAAFDRSKFGLKTLPVRIIEGLIFTTFAAQPLDLAPAAAGLAQSAGVHGWGKAKVAYQETFTMQANWKLAVENYMECYHCAPAHGEYAKTHALARSAAQIEAADLAAQQRSAALGIDIPNLRPYGCAAPPGTESFSVLRGAIYDATGGVPREGERPPAPLMGDFAAFDGNSTYMSVGPISTFLAYPDYGVIYRFIPKSVLLTEMEVIWLVREDAEEGKDYDVELLTWLWKHTSIEDKAIVQWNQAGVNSRYFEPGPYSEPEISAQRFTEWYLSDLAHCP